MTSFHHQSGLVLAKRLMLSVVLSCWLLASLHAVEVPPTETKPTEPPVTTALTVVPALRVAPKSPVELQTQAVPASTMPVATTSSSMQLSPEGVLAVTERLSEFAPTAGMKGVVRCLGSGISVVSLMSLGQALHDVQPEVQLEVGPPSDKDRLAALVNGTTDLIALAYLPTPEALQKVVSDAPGCELVAVPFAINPVVFYVNRNNPIAGLSLAQVGAMVGRHQDGKERAETWSDVGVSGPLANRPITVVVGGRNLDQSSHFRKKVLKIEDMRLDVRFAPTSGGALTEVGADETAFCIASLLYAIPVTRSGAFPAVRIVPLITDSGETVMPTVEAAQSGRYPLSRLLVLVTLKRDGKFNDLAREVLRYVVSRRGQRQVASLGVFPLTSERQQQALDSLR